MDALVEFFFKYPPLLFGKGDVVFGASWPARITVLVVAAAAAAAALTYMRVRVRDPRDRRILGALRALIVLVLAVALLRPTLVVFASISQRNAVGVVIDDSRSMQLTDVDGRPRADVVRRLLGGADSTLYKALAEKFVVRVFRLTGNGSRVASVADLPFDGARTHIAPALEGVRQELAGAAVAGLVLVSDGADNAPGTLGGTLLSLKARKLPVFTVGVGQERFAKDVEVSRVEAPRTVLKGTALMMNVAITQRGFGGRTVDLVVEEGGRLLTSQRVTLPRDGEATTARVRVPAEEVGAHRFAVRIVPDPGEQVVENNTRAVPVTVRDAKDKILYVEGEPRFELKFLRLAVAQDENLQLVTMVRMAKDRFLRLSIDDSLELLTGFPQTREELFRYRAIVLGSIEVSFFTLDQLRMISDFVSERGGGLLMLGGRTSFGEGGYAGTPIADALPVELPSGQDGTPVFREVKVSLTAAGTLYPLTQLASSETESAKRWRTLPVVTSVNSVRRAKPGAATLLTGAAPRGGDPSIVLASQRFGRGRTLAFSIQDAWQWQMHADIPVGDVTYQSFWRQVLRWLVSDAPGRVTVTPAADEVGPHEPLAVDVEVADDAFLKVNSADVTATITTPSDSVIDVPLEWSVTRDGQYRMTYTPTEPGVHRIDVTARWASDTATSEPAFVHVGVPTAEYFGAEQHASLLRRIAEETGGRYYTPATVAGLANDLVYSEAGTTAPERLDLWDMPIVFLLLAGLMATEWGYRRARGLV